MVGNETLKTPDNASEHEKLTVTGTLFQPLAFGATDLELVMTGGVRSTYTPLSVALAELPARSAQVPVTDWETPSPRVVGDDTLNTPDSSSEQEKLTVTGALFQPLALGTMDLELPMTGGVRSMFIPPTSADAKLPARSTHVPVTDWEAPSAAKIVGAGEDSTPESASEQANDTVTGPLFHPFTFALGDLEPEVLGGVLSMLIPLTVAEAVFPALSAHVALLDWPAPSEETT